MAGFINRLKQSWNVFTEREDDRIRDEDRYPSEDVHYGRLQRDTATAVLAPIITRLAIDTSLVPIRHVNLTPDGKFKSIRSSELDDRFNAKANIDQTGQALIQDAVSTMLEPTHGACVIVPTDLSGDPYITEGYDIYSLRIGTIVSFKNRSVVVNVYDENQGRRKDIELPKSFVAICQNPWYLIMNRPNSTLRRLVDKLSLLDIADNKAISPNLDLILQLPYAIRSETRQKEANKRLKMLEDQLYNSSYGVAYVDATERITQLNRPVANTLLEQVRTLTESLYNQLGLTQPILSGTATREELLDYHNRTIFPILSALLKPAETSFLSKTARSQNQALRAFPDLFKMAPLETIAEAADKLTRNEIMSSNEIRSVIGLAPDSDPESDELRNKNLNKPTEEQVPKLLEKPKEEVE